MKVDKSLLEHLSKKTLIEYIKLFPIIQNEKAKQYTTLILTLFALSIFGFFAIRPTLTTITELKRKQEDAKTVEAALSQKIANISLLRDKYNTLGDNLDAIFRALPTSAKLPQFVGQVQTIAQRTGIDLSNLQTGPIQVTQETPLPVANGSFTFGVEGRGTYDQIKNFLHLLLSFDRVVTIDTVSIIKDIQNPGILSLSMRGKAYFK